MKEDAIIIGGGWSLAGYAAKADLTSRGWVLGVNESSVLCKVCAGLTVDRLWFESRAPVLAQRGVALYYRKCIAKNLEPPLTAVPFKGGHFGGKLSDDPGILADHNSGIAAINLAYLRRPKRIFLLGFDCQRGLNNEPYYHAPYPWRPEGATTSGKFNQWRREFDVTAEQLWRSGIQVYNVTNRSALKCFDRLTFAQFDKETT